MNFLALAIGAGAVKNGVSTDVSTAATTVIGTGAGKKLGPAISAQTPVGLANTFAAVDTDRRPEKLIQTLEDKGDSLSNSAGSSFCFRCIHAGNYTDFGSRFKYPLQSARYITLPRQPKFLFQIKRRVIYRLEPA